MTVGTKTVNVREYYDGVKTGKPKGKIAMVKSEKLMREII
jgi:hypothetical protein